jgi:hypothetical protein
VLKEYAGFKFGKADGKWGGKLRAIGRETGSPDFIYWIK